MAAVEKVIYMKSRERRGQTSFEYVLIIAGVIIFVVIVAIVIRSGVISPGINQTGEPLKKLCQQKLSVEMACYTLGLWQYCNTVPASKYGACTNNTMPSPSPCPNTPATGYNFCGTKP